MNKIKKSDKCYGSAHKLKFSLLVLVLILFCSFLIVIATFTQFKIPTFSEDSTKVLYYVPQIPIILFIAGLLGRKFSLMSVIIYIFTGLFLAPIFALGGGLDYIINFNFGYILAYIPAVYFAGSITENTFSWLSTLKATLLGVLTIHIIGIIYLSIILTIQKEGIQGVLLWVVSQSRNTIFFDFVFGFVAIIIGQMIKKYLKAIS